MTDSKASTLKSQDFDEPAPPEQIADTYADRLMDELFDGVERALEGDVEALEVPPAPAVEATPALSELTLSFTEGGLPAVLIDRGSTGIDLSPQAELTAIAAAQPTPAPTPVSARPWHQGWTLNRILLGAAGLTLLATLGLWLQQRQEIASVATSPVPSPADAPAVSPEADFLEYLRRSLDVIAQNAPNTTVATGSTTSVSDVAIALNNGGVALPPVGNNVLPPQVPGGVPTAPGSINVIERVYVPYPAAQPGAAYPNNPAGASTQTGTTATARTPNAAPASIHTLVGVLELGERSAALFEIDGTPQRVYIGERVGDSGWSLVSVANEEAVIRRNGEVRTLYIGQRF